MSTTVNNPGDFIWKPLREQEFEKEYAVISKVSGTGVKRSYLLNSSQLQRWKLTFRTSNATREAIENFIDSKKGGHIPFTWRCSKDNVTYTVTIEGGLKMKTWTDNTADQRHINQEFELVFVRSY